MLTYPHMENSKVAPFGEKCVVFVKYDGSNLRWEWTPKKGWSKFGTRNHLFDHTTPIFKEAIPIFMDTMASDIEYYSKQIEKKTERITAFTEFLGPNSFAGGHSETDKKELKLFDVSLYKRGFVSPFTFVGVYGKLPYSAEVIYKGHVTQQLISDIRTGEYPVFEGAVVKGDGFSFKVKTYQYLDLLKQRYQSNWERFGE